jgi:hypothetical protein
MKIIKLGIRFSIELYRWLRYGHKYRSKKNMETIYTICQVCPHFVKDGGWMDGYDKCGICECNLHRSKRALNKIAWKTTSCPDFPSKWHAEIKSDGSEQSPF